MVDLIHEIFLGNLQIIQFQLVNFWTSDLIIIFQEEKWYSAALKEEVDKITIEKVELEEKTSFLEKVLILVMIRMISWGSLAAMSSAYQ